MKLFRKSLAVLLLVTVLALPAAGLCEGAGFETLKALLETPASSSIPVPEGTSLFDDVDDETDDGILALFMFGDTENESSIIISGINGNGKYEMRFYSGLNVMQMLYYSYVVSTGYSTVQSGLPGGAQYSILISYGEDQIILITDQEKADTFAESVITSIQQLVGQ